jgi:hypothetical protein
MVTSRSHRQRANKFSCGPTLQAHSRNTGWKGAGPDRRHYIHKHGDSNEEPKTEVDMSRTIIAALTAALLLGSTALASAQTAASPHYWGGGGYDGPGTPAYAPSDSGAGAAGPGYYAYAPGFHHRGHDNSRHHTGSGQR